MDSNDTDSVADFLQQYVFEGVWENFHEPAYSRWIWTLTNKNATVLFAAFTTFLTFTQPRAWAILRNLIARSSRSVGFEGRIDRNFKLSQSEALGDIIYLVGKGWERRRKAHRRVSAGGRSASAPPGDGSAQDDDIGRSPRFGITAFLNGIIFIAMGIAIPYFISDGALGAPIVRSRSTDSCVKSEHLIHFSTTLRQLVRADAIFQQCLDNPNAGCDTDYYFSDVNLEMRRLPSCPFSGDVCLPGIEPLEISHYNITAYDVGVNSRYRFSMSHRLTCTPVNLSPFTVHGSKLSGISVSQIDLNDMRSIRDNFTMLLQSRNGPNRSFPDEKSGLKTYKEDRVRDLTVLPSYFGGEDEVAHPELVSKALRSPDARPFLIVYRAGRTYFSQAINDPFFAAHNYEPDPDLPKFIPDHEATAIGCLEQYKYCAPDLDFCTPWGTTNSQAMKLLRFIGGSDPDKDLILGPMGELYHLYSAMSSWFEVFGFVAMRTGWLGTIPLRLHFQARELHFLDSNEEQWALEVETWFRKAILDAILYARTGARFNMWNLDSPVGQLLRNRSNICGRVLFRDGTHINVNWIGFWSTFATLIFIWILSFVVPNAERVAQLLTNLVERITQLLANLAGLVAKGASKIAALFMLWLMLVLRLISSALRTLHSSRTAVESRFRGLRSSLGQGERLVVDNLELPDREIHTAVPSEEDITEGSYQYMYSDVDDPLPYEVT